MLYLPTGWWHEVTSLATDERGPAQHVAVNYWFHPPDNLDPSAKGFGRPYRWVAGLGCAVMVEMVHFAVRSDLSHIPSILGHAICWTSGRAFIRHARRAPRTQRRLQMTCLKMRTSGTSHPRNRAPQLQASKDAGCGGWCGSASAR